MKIYLDFDGTVVENAYPEIGALNPGCLDVIRKLQRANHQIILNTYRADLINGTLELAIQFLNRKMLQELFNTKESAQIKFDPPRWNLDKFIRHEIIFIDDRSEGIPLRDNIVRDTGQMVDWKLLDKKFKEFGIYS